MAKLKLTKANRSNELWYQAKLLELVRTVRQITEQELSVLQNREHTWVGDSIHVGDVSSDEVTELFASIVKKLSGLDGVAKDLASLAAQRVLGKTDAALSEALKQSVKIDISSLIKSSNISKVLDRAIEGNVGLIKSIPEQYLSKVKGSVVNAVQRGDRWTSIVEKIQKDGEVTETRAKLIARDQVSKMNGSFNKARQQSIGINKYQWQGTDDGRERATHIQNNDKIFSWDDPPPETGHPGEDPLCRCVALPYFDLDAEEMALGIHSSQKKKLVKANKVTLLPEKEKVITKPTIVKELSVAKPVTVKKPPATGRKAKALATSQPSNIIE